MSDSNGSDAVQLTSMGPGASGAPRWSLDGNRIAFDSNPEGQMDIYVIAANGGKPQRLTSHPAYDGVPSWSHDGKWIYFCSNRSGQRQIWRMRWAPSGHGGEAVQVTRKGGFVALESPDGKWLYYTRAEEEAAGLWKVPVDGGEEAKVLESVNPRAIAVTAEGIYFLTYAGFEPAGTRRPLASLQFLSFATGKTKPIAGVEKAPLGLTGLTVSPDRRWILYTRTDQQGSDLMLVENFR